MECEVRVVAGMEGCFVSLPLHLIHTLQSTFRGPLPPFLALELRPRSGDRFWHVAWSSSASSSPYIEIAQHFADCINVSNHTIVQVRAVPNLPKATVVTIEPLTEDDWEVLELKSEYAETAILTQVGILHEGMKFPMWLQGKSIITFIVRSTLPNKPVVQLVPGTEVAVAPKRREKSINLYKDSLVQTSNIEHVVTQVLLRAQDLGDRYIFKCEMNGLEMEVVPTSVVYVHPETAKSAALESLQFVVITPKLSSRENNKQHENSKTKTSLAAMKGSDGILIDKKDSRKAIVRILASELVAIGHVMLSQSLRLYLRAGLHSWIYLKRCNFNLRKEVPAFSLSPSKFKFLSTNYMAEIDDLKVLGSNNNRMTKSMVIESDLDTEMGIAEWSIHERMIATLSCRSCVTDDVSSTPTISDSREGILNLLHMWCLAQQNSVSLIAGVEVDSSFLGTETLLHFRVKTHQLLKFGTQRSLNEYLKVISRARDSSIDILFSFSSSEKPLHSEIVDVYELAFGGGSSKSAIPRKLDLLHEKLQLGDGLTFTTDKERASDKTFGTTVSSLHWMGTTASDLANRLTILLSPVSGLFFSAYDLPFPGHILIYGPPGSGKTLLGRTVAKYVEEDEDILAHIVFVSCAKLSLEKHSTIRQALSSYISEAMDHGPSVLIFDDLDSVISSSSDLEGSQLPSSVIALTDFLVDIMDEYEEKLRNSCGIGPVAIIASVQSLTNLPQSLTSSGRFDYHVQLPAPAAAERGALLKHEIANRSLQCFDDFLLDIASKCDGYDAYDLEILVDRAVHAAVGRHLSLQDCKKPDLVRDDFLHAMHDFVPVSMRDITKSAAESCRSGWEDVGGLSGIRNAIREMIELPSKFPKIFVQAPLRMRSNVLLYGPPGCGKTHIVGAAAAACDLRFISVKGPELLNKYIGASEQAVRDIFSKAAAAAPCLLFFDEFDSIAPKRGHDNTGVTDRVVNQFLTELDGVEVLTGVFVFAATSRPDLLDAALLRPGRLDRLLFCDFPSEEERLDILTVLSRKLPLASDVDLKLVAQQTEGFCGADLQALLSDAQLAAVHDALGRDDNKKPAKKPIITNDFLKSVTSKARPSVSDSEKQRLYEIYGQFLDSKRSIAAQSRDAKGKRATLA